MSSRNTSTIEPLAVESCQRCGSAEHAIDFSNSWGRRFLVFVSVVGAVVSLILLQIGVFWLIALGGFVVFAAWLFPRNIVDNQITATCGSCGHRWVVLDLEKMAEESGEG